jgi:integrase
MPVNLSHQTLPPTLRGIVSVNSLGLPRFFATIWSDALNSWEASTRRRHLAALDRFYQAVEEQNGVDCLDRLIADVDCDALEDCLVGFLAQLRNEAVIRQSDNTPTWTTAVEFIKEMLQQAQKGAGPRANGIAAKILRLETYYGQLVPNSPRPPPPIRALPPLVVEDLYEIFRPDSSRNPFKTESLRWRNLLIFMLLLRLGLRRAEGALLYTGSFKEDFDPRSR